MLWDGQSRDLILVLMQNELGTLTAMGFSLWGVCTTSVLEVIVLEIQLAGDSSSAMLLMSGVKTVHTRKRADP